MRLFLIVFAAVSVLISCEDSPSTIGSDFFDDGSLDVIYVDSLTLKVSTVWFDSMATSDASRLLIGNHSDPQLGKLTVSSIFQIAPDEALTLDEDYTTYSRTTIVLVPDGYSYYDTSASISINVHELTQTMELDEDYLYNSSSIAYNADPIGTLTFIPRPGTSDTLEIPLADAFGSEIFSMAQQEADEVSTSEAFIEAFQGLALIPDTSQSGAILGYNTSPEVRIYYWDKTNTPSEEKYLTIKGGSHLKFNKIFQSRTGTAFSEISSQRESLSTALTNNTAIIQGGTGLALRIEIPYLKTILLGNDNLSIAGAKLELYPIDNAERNTPLPSSLTASIVNYKNVFSTTQQSFKADLVKDEYLDRDTRYEVDIHSFFMEQLATEELNENALLFSMSDVDYRQSVDVVRIGDQNSEKEMKLKLYLVVTNNQE